MGKICKWCNSTKHTSFYCNQKPRKPLPRQGKNTLAWQMARKKWLKKNLPNHQGYYLCYICHKAVPDYEITLDHVIPRSARPDLKYNFDNLQPCCFSCNSEKGSKH